MTPHRIIFAVLLILLMSTVASASVTDAYSKGYADGKFQAVKDCNQYGEKDVLTRIPEKSCDMIFNERYVQGFVIGYNECRYLGLKNK
jgi:opacity protein-like surface antigen